jgi:hypothetical protein
MTQLTTRLRELVGSLGNNGALANVGADMARAAKARRAVDQLERRLARTDSSPAAPAAPQVASHAA